MDDRKISSRFSPIFSGIDPTANMTLPTYLRQLQYIEEVLSLLIEESDENFRKFDVYVIDQLGYIEDVSREIVEGITADVISAQTEAEVERQVELITGSIQTLIGKIETVEADLVNTDAEVVTIKSTLVNLQSEVDSIAGTIASTLADAKSYTDGKLIEAKSYTDDEISTVTNSIDRINGDLAGFNTTVDDKVNPIMMRVDLLEANKLAVDTKFVELEKKVDKSNTTILGQRVSDVEASTGLLKVEIDTLKTNAPDISGLTTRMVSAETSINVNAGNISTANLKIGNLETKSTQVDTKLTTINGRLDAIETPDGSESIEGRVSNLESDRNIIDNRLTVIEDEDCGERITSVESRVDTLELKDMSSPNHPTEIKFPAGKQVTKNQLNLVMKPWGGNITYKGVLVYDYNGLTSLGTYTALTDTTKPLNIPSEVTGKSEFPQGPIIHYHGEYKISGEVESIEGFDLYSRYVFTETPDMLDGKVSIESDKLEAIYTDILSKEVTDLKFRVIIEAELTVESVL